MITTQPLPLWLRRRKMISPSDSLIVDTYLKSKFSALRYSLTIFNTLEGKNYTADIVVGKTPTGIVEVLSSKINASNLNIQVNGSEDASNFHLSIVNNESFEIIVEYARLTLKG